MQRFWDKVDKSGECWLWTAYKNPDLSPSNKGGYGRFGLDGKLVYAHRFSWELANGPIPSGMRVLHQCDIRNCVRPSHLFLGSQIENMQDCIKKGRFAQPPLRFGESHHNTKLCEIDVWLIRNLDLQHCRIADFFDIHKTTVSRIRRRQSWKHLA